MKIDGTVASFHIENEIEVWYFKTTIHNPLVSLHLTFAKHNELKDHKFYAWSFGITNNQIRWGEFIRVEELLKITPKIKRFAQDEIDRLVKLKGFL